VKWRRIRGCETHATTPSDLRVSQQCAAANTSRGVNCNVEMGRARLRPSRHQHSARTEARPGPMKSWPSPTRTFIQVLLRPPVDVDPGRRRHRYLRRVDHRNQCDRLDGVMTKFVLHSKRTDFGGRGLPEFPMISIFQPICCNILLFNVIRHLFPMFRLCSRHAQH
jgi:hypothetical protein